MISIQLRHHFLFSPLFPFFPPLIAWSLEETLFPQKKKSDSRLHRQKATRARMGLWDKLSSIRRQTGRTLCFRIFHALCVGDTFKSFWKDLQHLWIVCLVRKERTIFLFVFAVVLLIVEQIFCPNDVFIFMLLSVWCGRSRSSSAWVPHVHPSA